MDRLKRPGLITESFLTLLCGISAGFLVMAINVFDVPIKYTAVIIAALAAAIVILVVRDIKRLLIGAIFIDMATGFDVHVPCVDHYFVSECGFNISLTVIALLILYTLWIIEFQREHGTLVSLRPKAGIVGRFGASFVLASLVSLTAAQDASLSLYMVWIYIMLLALFFYLVNHIHTQQDLLMIVMLLAIGLFLQGFIMQLKVVDIIPNDTVLRFQQRTTGTFKSPNSAGAYLMQMILLLLPTLALKMTPWQRRAMIVSLFVASYSLVGTSSRGAWTGVLVGVVIILMMSILKKWLNVKTLAFILIAITILGTLFSGTIITRLEGDDNGAADARGPLMEIAWNMILANPVVGVGWNNFGLALYDYIEIDQFGAWLNLVHNAWLLIWSETGTISFLIYVTFWLVIAWYALKLIWRGQQFYGLLALGILACMVGAATHMMVEIYASRILAQILWTNAALIMAMTRIQQREDAILVSRLSSTTSKGILA